MSGCEHLRLSLAAYSFEALDPGERVEVERHLEGCDACRAACAELQRLRVLLDIAGSTDASFASPPPLLESSVLAAIPGGGARSANAPAGRRRSATARAGRRLAAGGRRGRWVARPVLAGALALVAVLLAVGIASLTVRGGGRKGWISVVLTPTASYRQAGASVRVRPRPWGTELVLVSSRLPATADGEHYEVVLSSTRRSLSAGTFTVPARRRVTVTLAAAARLRRGMQMRIALVAGASERTVLSGALQVSRRSLSQR
jgi:hypothetical protein